MLGLNLYNLTSNNDWNIIIKIGNVSHFKCINY